MGDFRLHFVSLERRFIRQKNCMYVSHRITYLQCPTWAPIYMYIYRFVVTSKINFYSGFFWALGTTFRNKYSIHTAVHFSSILLFLFVFFLPFILQCFSFFKLISFRFSFAFCFLNLSHTKLLYKYKKKGQSLRIIKMDIIFWIYLEKN